MRCLRRGLQNQRWRMAAEFWRLPRVIEVTGISRSEIYRQIRFGEFPPSRSYKGCANARFWLSTEVQGWMASQIGEAEWAALHRQPDEYDALLG